MFHKAFRVKSNTTIRGSDRRKLRSEVGRAFPSLSHEMLSEVVPSKEEMTVMRIMSHSGHNAVAYCLSGEPVFFEVEGKIFPTVYTLWKYPDIVPQFTTWPPVFEKLKGGADLMLPGVILPPQGLAAYGKFEKNTTCCVTLKGNRAAVAVGMTAVSYEDVLEDGMRGKAVLINHMYTDLLWAQGSKIVIPQISEPEAELKCEDSETAETICAGPVVEGSCTEMDEEEERDAREQDFRKLEISDQDSCSTGAINAESCSNQVEAERQVDFTEDVKNGEALCESTDIPDDCETEEAGKSTPENMDDLLEFCFFCALLKAKKITDPILTSAFFRSYVLPSCPEGKSVDIKKSSYKKVSKFLQVMQERGFIKMKEVSKGVDSIEAFCLDHADLKAFKASKPKAEPKLTPTDSEKETSASQQGPVIEELFAVSAALLPVFKEFGLTKNAVVTPSEVRSVMTQYVKSHELVHQQNKRLIVLDPTLTKALLNKNEHTESLAWDELFEKITSKMNFCHKIRLAGQQPIIRKGKIETIDIKTEQRMGNKKVTLVRNLELYGIDPQQFAHTMQVKAASSTAVSQLPGKTRAPAMQVLIQGTHVKLVAVSLLDDYNIPRKYVTGLEQIKSKKKK